MSKCFLTAYRRYLGAADPWALHCAYQAGHAYAQAGKPAKALPQLRYYVLNAAALASRDADEAAKVPVPPARESLGYELAAVAGEGGFEPSELVVPAAPEESTETPDLPD